MPPLEGEVVERQRNRRGLYVNRAVQENPSVRFVGSEVPSDSFPPGEAKSGNFQLSPFNEPLCYATFRAAGSRPYGSSGEAGSIHRTTPPQSARSGCQLSQRESQGRFAPRTDVAFTSRRCLVLLPFPVFRLFPPQGHSLFPISRCQRYCSRPGRCQPGWGRSRSGSFRWGGCPRP